jgi:hypothetical protein
MNRKSSIDDLDRLPGNLSEVSGSLSMRYGCIGGGNCIPLMLAQAGYPQSVLFRKVGLLACRDLVLTQVPRRRLMQV